MFRGDIVGSGGREGGLSLDCSSAVEIEVLAGENEIEEA